jgi:hypothetical protein
MLYVSRALALYVVDKKPTQLGPLDVQPGYEGLPKGLEALGCVDLTSKPVCVYESPKTKSCLTFFHPDHEPLVYGAARLVVAKESARAIDRTILT